MGWAFSIIKYTMDYYYALLKNYEQLKQRKFNISMREAASWKQDLSSKTDISGRKRSPEELADLERKGKEAVGNLASGDAKKAIEDASLGIGKQVALDAAEGWNARSY